MKRRMRPSRWIVVFVGVSDKDKKAVVRCIDTVIKKLSLQERIIDYRDIDASVTREIGRLLSTEGEIQEIFAESVINSIDQWKRASGFKNVAIVMSKNSFITKEVFKTIVNHYAFNDVSLHPICFKGDFLNISARENCITRSCKDCMNFDQCDNHSCLLRLIWLLFDSDKRIVDILKDMNGL